MVTNVTMTAHMPGKERETKTARFRNDPLRRGVDDPNEEPITCEQVEGSTLERR
jgi:hypothetical protein